MKKQKKKKATFIRPLYLSLATFLILFFYSWVSDTIYTVHLPDGQKNMELYSTEMQDDLSLTMSKAISEAKESVTLIIYTLSDPKIIKSLREKSQSTCVVKVICNATTCLDVEKKLGSRVKVLKRFIKGLMHIKILIIDAKQTWIGSANMTRESLRHHGNLVMAIESESIAEMASAKARSFTETKRLHSIPYGSFSQGEQKAELWFLPDDPRAIGRLKGLIQGAQKTLRIAMFTWTRRDLADEVIAAKKRGVKVEVVLDKKTAAGTSAGIAKMLLNGGVKVKLSQGQALLHHKFMQIDGKTLVNGSANWTKAAFESNDDCFVVLSPLLEDQRQFLDKMWSVILGDSTDAY